MKKGRNEEINYLSYNNMLDKLGTTYFKISNFFIHLIIIILKQKLKPNPPILFLLGQSISIRPNIKVQLALALATKIRLPVNGFSLVGWWMKSLGEVLEGRGVERVLVLEIL